MVQLIIYDKLKQLKKTRYLKTIEITEAVKTSKNGKSSGVDGIINEMLLKMFYKQYSNIII